MAKLVALVLAIVTLLPILATSFSDENPTDRRILILIDNLALSSTHSLFFNSLRTRDFDLDFKLADNPKLALCRYSQYLYDGLILFAPSTKRFGGSLDLAAITDFVDSGHDLILAADTSAFGLIQEIATECGVDFNEDPAAVVVDYTSYAVSETEGDHTVIASDDFIKSEVILGEAKIEAPVLFRGIGHPLNAANSLVVKALAASPSAYSANPNTELSSPPSLTGAAISLVSVVQARSSTKYEKSGNEQFVTEISKWVFYERGHLKAVNVSHHKVGETSEPAMYRINDDLEYSVEVYEWSGSS